MTTTGELLRLRVSLTNYLFLFKIVNAEHL